MDKIHAQIKNEIYKALEGLGACMDLLSIVGSYRDTQSDKDTLEMLRNHNAGEPLMAKVIASDGTDFRENFPGKLKH